MDKITRFDGEYRFLSNFWMEPVVLMHSDHGDNTVSFKSAEHAYQCFKAMNEEDFECIRKAPTPGQAKRIARTIEVVWDWDNIKLQVMAVVLAFKFKEGSELAEKLLATGDAELIEGNTWGDRFWGVCRGEGENWLGRLLMARRAYLKNQKEKETI